MYVNLGAVEQPWYTSLLQTGATLYNKYQAIADVKKQQKTVAEYKAYLEEQARLVAQQRAMEAELKATKTTPSYVPYYILGGGAIIAALMYMKR